MSKKPLTLLASLLWHGCCGTYFAERIERDGAPEVGRGMQYNRRKDLITVRGILVPVEWDESGRVLTTAVFTDQEDEFVIDKNNKGEELCVHLRAEVEVTGRLRETEGMRIIRVEEFTLRKSFDQQGKVVP